MVRLLLKIFLAYWLAAGVVIVISDYEPHRHIHNPELNDALESSLAFNGRALIDAYESGHCQQQQHVFTTARDAFFLAAPDGHLLCGDPQASGVPKLISMAVSSGKRTTDDHMWFQLIATPVTSPSGTHYVLLLRNYYSSALQVGGNLPGYTTIAISVIVTLFLAILIALPIRRLRSAAGEIALGRLDSRVHGGMLFAQRSRYAGDDITELIRDFNHMAGKLQSLADAQRLLLRDLSHELRSPLTRLGVGLGLARAENPSPEVSVHLDQIQSESIRLNHLIGQILSLSHLELIQKLEEPHVISLSELVVDLLPDLQYEAMQSDCVIGTTIATGCYVRGDEELLRSAVENILRNAIKYASGNGVIHVETANEQRSGVSFSTVRVGDNGPGIPEEEIDSVLEPFYRADRERHWKQEGSGIGLAIADRAARLHRGIIGVRNKPDGGLIVEISFPAVFPTTTNLSS